jgi:hypothetical protein
MNTRELREICRDTHRRGYNRNLTPAQFKLLDPKGTHILGVRLMHRHKDEEPCEEHVRMFAHIKLLGQHKAVERYIDVAMDFVSPFFATEEIFDQDDPEIRKFMEENAGRLEEMNREDLPERFHNHEEVIREIREMAEEDGTTPPLKEVGLRVDTSDNTTEENG